MTTRTACRQRITPGGALCSRGGGVPRRISRWGRGGGAAAAPSPAPPPPAALAAAGDGTCAQAPRCSGAAARMHSVTLNPKPCGQDALINAMHNSRIPIHSR